jgi:hypothetical protein
VLLEFGWLVASALVFGVVVPVWVVAALALNEFDML